MARARLYWMSVSHPSQAARRMLDMKGIEYEVVNVLPLNQRVHLRLAGFRGGTVPALKLDGRRIQGSRQIAGALDEVMPDPPLVPTEPGLRARVQEAERWGDEVLQPVPRRLARYGAWRDLELRRWAARAQRFPAPELVARISGPLVRHYANTVEADGGKATEAVVQADLAGLPALLDHADSLLADGTLSTAPPNAATLQILSSLRLLDSFTDLHPFIHQRLSVQAARQVFPDYPVEVPPFLPAQWLEPLGAG